ncbi:MAG: cytidine deaminase [Oligoflexia bacterium]|nr:cytidine deaminase [Oligoflexia bacterium]
MLKVVLFLLLVTFSHVYAADKIERGTCNTVMESLALTPPNPEITKQLEKFVPAGTSVVSKAAADKLAKMLNISTSQLMIELIPLAKKMASPPISEYYVGVVGRAKETGDLIFGVNLEFPNHTLNQTVHGEQFMLARAMSLKVKQIESLAVSASPCGHCRQFLNETDGGSEMNIFWPKTEVFKLKALLPFSFGPLDLGETSGLLNTKSIKLKISKSLTGDELTLKALEAAENSYAPYSKNYSGVAIKIHRSKTIITGSYMENAAFNPSLSPLQAALVNLVAEGFKYSDIEALALVEAQKPDGKASSSQVESTSALLRSIAPNANAKYVKAKWE